MTTMWAGAVFVVILLAGLAVVVALLVAPERALAGLVATGLVVLITAGVVATTVSPRSSVDRVGSASFSHAQLEADRVMTAQMSLAVGPGMQAQMFADGMLRRSSNEAYVRALEQHTYEVERMLGRVP